MSINNLNSLKDSNSCTELHFEDEVKEGYRVRVCLQRYFSDERSQAYVNISRQRPVLWLEQRLKNLFDLKGLFCLCSNGYFLPSQEPLSILQPNDPVEVIPMSKKVFDSGKAISSRTNLQSNESANTHSVNDSNETQNCSAEIVNISVVGRMEEKDNALVCMKQQALALLETCCENTGSAVLDSGHAVYRSSGGDRPRRTRRRLRRRKRHLSGEDSGGGIMDSNKEKVKDTVQSAIEKSNTACTSMQEKASAADFANAVEDIEGGVVRDNSVETRRARLVRSISPSRT